MPSNSTSRIKGAGGRISNQRAPARLQAGRRSGRRAAVIGGLSNKAQAAHYRDMTVSGFRYRARHAIDELLLARLPKTFGRVPLFRDRQPSSPIRTDAELTDRVPPSDLLPAAAGHA